MNGENLRAQLSKILGKFYEVCLGRDLWDSASLSILRFQPIPKGERPPGVFRFTSEPKLIFIGTQDIGLAKSLKKRLNELGANVLVCSPREKGFFEALYRPDVTAVVADEYFHARPSSMSLDLLSSLGQRVPVIVLASPDRPHSLKQYSEQLTIVSAEHPEDILTALGVLGSLENSNFKAYCKSVPYYNIQIPINILRETKGLGIVSIDASGFSRIGLEYGIDVYTRLKEVFQSILYELWGEIGSFRETDILCRKSMASNTYYLFLSKSRATGSLPLPGALEKLCDRLIANIQNALWDELYAPADKKRLPDCVTSIPLPSVGYVGVLHNPCIDPRDIIEEGLEDAKKVAFSQSKRLKERQLELMQTLIQSDELLVPKYQGVFTLKGLTKEALDQAHGEKSIGPLASSIFGFESLIRINGELTQELMTSAELDITGLEPQYLKPDVLFGMAKSTKVSLELDQACLRHAAAQSGELPGILMVNILPRNLYYIDRLRHIFKDRKNVMFEVSESEAINNFELMKKSCALLEKLDMTIAADDFGRGYSSLERIIKIRPSVIKFDRSMIENIHADPIKQAYVKGMVEAARYINTTVLAEGVEIWEEAEVLQAIGIDLVQGFLFHRPETAEEIEEQLNRPIEVENAS